MAGTPPVNRLIVKNEGDQDWQEIAAAWRNASGKITVTFTKDVPAGTRALWVDVDRPAPQQRRAPGAEPGQ